MIEWNTSRGSRGLTESCRLATEPAVSRLDLARPREGIRGPGAAGYRYTYIPGCGHRR